MQLSLFEVESKAIEDMTDQEIEEIVNQKRKQLNQEYDSLLNPIDEEIQQVKREIAIRKKRRSAKASREIETYMKRIEELEAERSNISRKRFEEFRHLTETDPYFIEETKRLKRRLEEQRQEEEKRREAMLQERMRELEQREIHKGLIPVEAPEIVDLALITKENFKDYADSIETKNGVGKHKGKIFYRITIKRPVLHEGRIYDEAHSEPFTLDNEKPISFKTAGVHEYQRYLDRLKRWNSLLPATQERVYQLETLLKNKLEFSNETKVQVGELLEGKRNAVISSNPLARILNEEYNLQTWAELKTII